MLLFKRLLFKLLELGLGVRPYFSLQTRDPVFVNFRLTAEETDAVRRALPAGFTLRAIRFAASDPEPAFWISYNVYELRYPRPEMARLRKVRCEINTFVRDAGGRDGVFVFCGSPFVSKEERPSAIGRVADLAERLVLFLYGGGGLVRLRYELTDAALRISLGEPEARLEIDVACSPPPVGERARLSEDYYRCNDVSFFDAGRTHDLVSAGSPFLLATLEELELRGASTAFAESPFFRRPPDRLYVHRGEIGYLVSALHRGPAPAASGAP